jgi:hypothetical protein
MSEQFLTTQQIADAIASGRTDFSGCRFFPFIDGTAEPQVDFSGLDLNGAVFEQGVYNTSFRNAELTNAVFNDAAVNCDLSVAVLQQAFFSERVTNCNFTSATLDGTRFAKTTTRNSFVSATLSDVAFEGDNYDNNFNYGTLGRVRFGSRADYNVFDYAAMAEVDFEGRVVGNSFYVEEWRDVGFHNALVEHNQFGAQVTADETEAQNSLIATNNDFAIREQENSLPAVSRIDAPFASDDEFSQGPLNTCQLLSAVNSLKDTPEGLAYLNNHVVQFDPQTQQFAVRFDGVRPPEGVVIHIGYEEALGYNGSYGSLGVTVLEAAFMKLVNDRAYALDLAAATPWVLEKAAIVAAPEKTFPLLDPFYLLTGHRAEEISMEDVREYSEQEGHEQMVYTGARVVMVGEEGFSVDGDVNAAVVNGYRFHNYHAMSITVEEGGVIGVENPMHTARHIQLSDEEAAAVFESQLFAPEVYAFDLGAIADKLSHYGIGAIENGSGTTAADTVTQHRAAGGMERG